MESDGRFKRPLAKMKLSELPCSKLAQSKRRRHLVENSSTKLEMDLLDELLKDTQLWKDEISGKGFTSSYQEYVDFVDYLKLVRSQPVSTFSIRETPKKAERFSVEVPDTVSSVGSRHSDGASRYSSSAFVTPSRESLSSRAFVTPSRSMTSTPISSTRTPLSRSASPMSVASVASLRAPRSITPLSSEQSWIRSIREKVEKVLSTKYDHFQVETPVFESINQKSAALDKKFAAKVTNNFPILNSEMMKTVERAFAARSGVVASAFNIEIRPDDLDRLRPGQWLNDELINYYGNLIMKRSQASKSALRIHYFNTFFYSNLKDVGYQKVRRWTKKIDLFAKDVVLFPVHLGVHWCCGAIDMRKKRIEYYDSLHGLDSAYFDIIKDYLKQESDDKKKPIDLGEWECYAPKNIPAQENGYDCGVFTCIFAEYRSRDESFDFNQSHMKYMRQRLVYEIVSENLLVEL